MFLPPANVVWGKVIFLHLSVILITRGWWYPSMHCRWYSSMPCSRSPGGEGMVSQHALQEESQHALQVSRGVSRPTPREEIERSGQEGLQVHTWGSPGPHPGGSPGPHPRGSPGQHPRGSPSPHPRGEGCVSQHALWQTPPRGRLLPRAVRILLECILVISVIFVFFKKKHLMAGTKSIVKIIHI